jgi:tripartite-type tricarboxylate transporter receptor subunit TctC
MRDFTRLTRRGLVAGAAGALAMPLLPHAGWAADAFPDRPIDLVVAFPPGGGADVFARIVAKGLEATLGQPVIPINKPGAGSVIGSNYVKNARPDGYTLLWASIAFLINPIIRHVDYDPVADFDALGMVARATYVLVSNPKRGFRTVSDLIAYAKEHPGALKFGSPGIGVSGQLAGDLLRSMADIKFVDVRYKGSSEAVLATMSGEVDFCFDSPAALIANIKTGRLTLLASGSETRDPLYPDAPTIAETLPGYSVLPWFGLVAPRGVPAPALEVLRAATGWLAQDADTNKRLKDAGVEPFNLPAAKFTTFLAAERDRWSKVASREPS